MASCVSIVNVNHALAGLENIPKRGISTVGSTTASTVLGCVDRYLYSPQGRGMGFLKWKPWWCGV